MYICWPFLAVEFHVIWLNSTPILPGPEAICGIFPSPRFIFVPLPFNRRCTLGPCEWGPHDRLENGSECAAALTFGRITLSSHKNGPAIQTQATRHSLTADSRRFVGNFFLFCFLFFFSFKFHVTPGCDGLPQVFFGVLYCME